MDPFPPVLVLWGEVAHEQLHQHKKTKRNPFKINRNITVDGQSYTHLCSVMNSPRHFWTVVTWNEATWVGGLEPLVFQVGPEEWEAEYFRGRLARPIVHVYKLVNDGNQKVGGDNPMERKDTTTTVAAVDRIEAI